MARETPSLTVVVTAYNEEENLRKTVATARDVLRGVISDYEILIIDDASSDGTSRIADDLAREISHTRVVHHSKNMNQGPSYKESVGLATKEYHYLIPGDDMIERESLRRIVSATGRADIILPYVENMEIRHPLRSGVSRMFVEAMNLLFGLKLRYYNGPVIVRTELLRSINVSTSFMFVADTVVKLLRKKHTYLEVPMKFNRDAKGANLRAIRRNFFSVLLNILKLFWEVRVKPFFGRSSAEDEIRR